MKKIVVVMLLMMSALSLSAQLYVSPKIGMTALKPEFAENWSSGWKIGTGVEYMFKPGLFSLESGLYYTNRPFVIQNSVILDQKEGTLSVYGGKSNNHYLQIPLQAKFNWEVGADKRIYVAAGPYVGLSLKNSGRVDHQLIHYGEAGNELPVFIPGYGGYYSGYGYFSGYELHSSQSIRKEPTDWGVLLSLGIDIKQWTFGVGYDLSLKENRDKYQTFNLTIGYKFKLAGK